MREEEAASGAKIVEEEQFLLLSTGGIRLRNYSRYSERTCLANLSMVTLSSFSQEGFVLRQLFLIREGDTIHSLQRVVVGIAEEV